MTYNIVVYTVKNSYDGQGNCPKHVDLYYKNKFEILVHLVGFIIRTRMQLNLTDIYLMFMGPCIIFIVE